MRYWHSGGCDFPMLEQLRGALRIYRTAEIISLGIRAAGGKEKVRLSLGLDAFGYNLNTKLLRKANCGAHHCGIARIGCDPEDELLRDFQPVDGVDRKIFQGRIAGSKIVDWVSDSDLPKMLECFAILLRDIHQHRFRKLNFDVARLDVPTLPGWRQFRAAGWRPFHIQPHQVPSR